MFWLLIGIRESIPFFGAACGMLSALYWYRAGRVETIPLWQKLGQPEPVVQELRESGWIGGIIEAGTQSARLNKVAALWTAATVFLSSIPLFLARF